MPGFVAACWHRSWVRGQLGDHQGAIEDARTAYENSDGNPLFILAEAWAQALAGNGSEARSLLAKLSEDPKADYVSSYHLATVHVALGEMDRAFELLEEAEVQRCSWRHFLMVDPRMIPLRDEPRFVKLTERLGF